MPEMVNSLGLVCFFKKKLNEEKYTERKNKLSDNLMSGLWEQEF